jgi:hypothetical protein
MEIHVYDNAVFRPQRASFGPIRNRPGTASIPVIQSNLGGATPGRLGPAQRRLRRLGGIWSLCSPGRRGRAPRGPGRSGDFHPRRHAWTPVWLDTIGRRPGSIPTGRPAAKVRNASRVGSQFKPFIFNALHREHAVCRRCAPPTASIANYPSLLEFPRPRRSPKIRPRVLLLTCRSPILRTIGAGSDERGRRRMTNN